MTAVPHKKTNLLVGAFRLRRVRDMERKDVLENRANPDPPPLAASDMPDIEKLSADVVNDITSG